MNAEKHMDRLFETILGKLEWDDFYAQNFSLAVGVILASFEPLPLEAYSKFVSNGQDFQDTIQGIKYLFLPFDDNGKFQTLHQSLRDYLTSCEISKPYHINVKFHN